MINILAKIQVKNFAALEKFEHEAAKLIAEHNGRIIAAFETLRNSDSSGEEIHLLEFQSKEDFQKYREDQRHLPLQELRAQAISETEIKVSLTIKSYV